MASASASAVSFAPDDTPDGELPPWEVAKAFAFKVVRDKVAETRKLTANPPSPPFKDAPSVATSTFDVLARRLPSLAALRSSLTLDFTRCFGFLGFRLSGGNVERETRERGAD